MPRFLALLLPLAVLACTEPTQQATSPPPGAVHYHLRQGSQLLSCVTFGFDTVCRSA
jgi:hypothetical protein